MYANELSVEGNVGSERGEGSVRDDERDFMQSIEVVVNSFECGAEVKRNNADEPRPIDGYMLLRARRRAVSMEQS